MAVVWADMTTEIVNVLISLSFCAC